MKKKFFLLKLEFEIEDVKEVQNCIPDCKLLGWIICIGYFTLHNSVWDLSVVGKELAANVRGKERKKEEHLCIVKAHV